tara:strand:- start:1723 stop:2280 length:558 start_codon:yes stop_codon:yes gene_type:complete
LKTTLVGTIWQSTGNSLLKQVGLAVLGTILLAISAKVQVPFWPVPMTMQTFVVLVLGIAYGARLGLATGVLYMLEGIFGLPVFATGSGYLYVIGPTGGYLFGFILAMGIIGWLAERRWDRSVPSIVGAMLIGEAIIFSVGIAWLASLIGIDRALQAGLYPFIAAEVFKIVLAAATIPLIWRRLAK